MDFMTLKPEHLLLIAFVGFMVFRFYRFKKVKGQIPALIAAGAKIVDVRSPAEFSSASNPNSINIPLNQISTGAKKLDKQTPIVVCCASGSRSAMAARALKTQGFENVINAGPWTNTLIKGVI